MSARKYTGNSSSKGSYSKVKSSGNRHEQHQSSSSSSLIATNQEDDGQIKPRRLEDDTAEYLMKIEMQLSKDSILDEDDKSNLIENVLSEVSQRTASASCDRRTNFLIEKLCSTASVKNLVEIIKSFIPYAIFLARNRYSSHILQTIIARICYIIKFDDYGEHGDLRSDMMDTIQRFCEPIMSEMKWLILEQSASHVVRSILSLLSGIPVIAERKGKGSKHQHSVALSEPLDSLLEAHHFYISSTVAFPVPESFHELLLKSAYSLLKLSTKDMESLLSNFSSSAVFGLLIRILSNPTVVSATVNDLSGSQITHRIYYIALGYNVNNMVADESNHWHDMMTDNHHRVQQTIYSMAGDRAGSYFLEALIECSNMHFMASILSHHILGTCSEYIQDGSGNFVIQAFLRRISSILHLHGSNKQQQQDDIKWLWDISISLVRELLYSDYFMQLVNVKGGVALWLLVLTRNLSSMQPYTTDGDDDVAEHVGIRIIKAWVCEHQGLSWDGMDDSDDALQIGLTSFLNTKLMLKAKSTAINADDAKGSSSVGGGVEGFNPHDTTQALIAKLMNELFKSKSTKVTDISTRAFSQVSSDCLKYIATSGPISRLLLDPFIDNHHKTSPFQALNRSLHEIGCELSQHFIGHHVIRRLYEVLDVRGREKWVITLTSDGGRIALSTRSSSKEVAVLLKLMNAELYMRDAAEWRNAIKKKMKGEQMLVELERSSVLSSSILSSSSSSKQKSGRQVDGKDSAVVEKNAGNNNKSINGDGREADNKNIKRSHDGDGGVMQIDGSEDVRTDKVVRKRKRKRHGKTTDQTAPDDD